MSGSSQPKTEVSFRSRAGDHTESGAVRDLAHSLANALRLDGFSCSDPEDIDYAHAIRCRVSTRDFYLLVGYVGDGAREWLISVTSDLGWLSRLLGADDEEELRQLTDTIHRIVSSSEDLVDVRWYTLEDWNQDPTSWSPIPHT